MKTKRIFAGLVALLMLMAIMPFGVFAADGGSTDNASITIETQDGVDIGLVNKTFEIYQIFDATTNADRKVAYQWRTDAGGNKLYYDFFYGESGCVAVGESDGSINLAVSYISGLDTSELIIFAHDLYEYIAGNPSLTYTLSDTASGDSLAFTGLDYGYYLVYESTTNPEVRAAVALTSATPTSTIKLKVDKPTVSKVITEGSRKAASFCIGDTINFTVSTTVPGMKSFSSYTYKITDDLPSTLTFDADSLVVKKEDTTLTAGTDYTLTPSANGFEISFGKIKEYTKGEKLSIIYDAVLNDTAEANVNDYSVNTATLTYSNDSTDADSVATTSSSVNIFTYAIELTKVDAANTGYSLTGAEFTLSRVNGTETKLNLNKIKDGHYKIKVGAAPADDIVLTTDSSGKLRIDGLSKGFYRLRETKAPDGYNVATEDYYEFEIHGEFADDTYTVDGLAMRPTNDKYLADGTNQVGFTGMTPGVSTGVVNGTDGAIKFGFTNLSGSELPETGGIGTTLFTFGGLILMAGALCFFYLRRNNTANA